MRTLADINKRNLRERRVALPVLLERLEDTQRIADDAAAKPEFDLQHHPFQPPLAEPVSVALPRRAFGVRRTPPPRAGTGAVAYCNLRDWTIVGYDLALLGRDDMPVRVDVLAIDQQDHYLAVTAVFLEGHHGIGIIDLNTAQARFSPIAAVGTVLRN